MNEQEFIRIRNEKTLEIGKLYIILSATKTNPVAISRELKPALDDYFKWVQENMPDELKNES